MALGQTCPGTGWFGRSVGLTIAVAVLAAVLVAAVGSVLPTALKKGVDWLRAYSDRLQRSRLAWRTGLG